MKLEELKQAMRQVLQQQLQLLYQGIKIQIKNIITQQLSNYSPKQVNQGRVPSYKSATSLPPHSKLQMPGYANVGTSNVPPISKPSIDLILKTTLQDMKKQGKSLTDLGAGSDLY